MKNISTKGQTKGHIFMSTLYKSTNNSKAFSNNNVNKNASSTTTNCKAIIINAIYNLNSEVNNNLKKFYNWGVVMFFEKKTCKKKNLAYYLKSTTNLNKRGIKISYAK